MMNNKSLGVVGAFLVTAWLCMLSGMAQDSAAPIPNETIAKLESSLADSRESSSVARKRLGVRRVLRDGQKLIAANPAAANRFAVLDVLFRAQQELLAMDDSPENRAGLLEICRQLVKAPDEFAAIRLDADLLLSQTELARAGADLDARGEALRPLVERYRNTDVDAKVLRTAMLMALEFGNTKLVADLRKAIAERHPGELEMIMFLRDKLAGQVFGAPFIGNFPTSDGKMAHFPLDYTGRTTALYFWSKENGEEDLKQLATTWKEKKDDLSGRIQIISFNLDDLPDAGEKILRGLGVDWPAIRIPGGRDNPVYRAYVQTDPILKSVTPSGYAALVMAGNRGGSGKSDYSRWVGSSMARGWTQTNYANHLQSIFTGEFLILDPGTPFDPTLPPELKAISGSRLSRTSDSVPEAKLRAIQDCFILPPFRYRTPDDQVRANYQKADSLCGKAIETHPQAPDLWIVRNRRIIALLGLWKLSLDHDYLERAVGEAKVAINQESPPGTDVVARFCIAREALRAADADADKMLGDFLSASGSGSARGPGLAAVATLALDVGDRALHERCRREILDQHTENPMMWTITSFLVDRYHRYWLFRAPYVAGWSFGRREGHFLAWGEPDDAHRTLQAELESLDGGKAFRIPEDTSGKWTAIIFMTDPNQGIPRGTLEFAEARPNNDVNIVTAMLNDDDLDGVRATLKEKPHGCPTVVVPGGMKNPLVQKLGILSEDERSNIAIIRPDGSIAVVLSGLTMRVQKSNSIKNVIEFHDEKAVDTALEKGDLEKARLLAFAHAPIEEPQPEDPKKRNKKRKVPTSFPHLRSRAKVYMAMKDWEAALADAEEACLRLKRRDGFLSLRTAELNETEELRDKILELQEKERRGEPAEN